MKLKQRMIRPVLYSSAVALFGYLSFSLPVQAAPQGGQIVGGTGSINQSGLTTNIKQNTQNLAINWNSYNLSSSEVVNYIQPDASSINNW